MTRSQLCFVLTVAVVYGVLTRSSVAGPTTGPTTQPVTPAQAVYQSNIEMVEMLLDSPTDEELVQIGKSYRVHENYARAAILHLTALRSKRDNPLIEYELACDFALWGQVKLGMECLQKAADHGYWGYLVVKDDTDLNALKEEPAFPGALAKIKPHLPSKDPGMSRA